MAGKPQNRLELRRQYEAAEDLDPMEAEAEVLPDDDEDEAERRPRKKKAPAKAKPKATKAVKPAARMRIVWVVVNDAFKSVATFEYSQKEAAQTRAEELMAKGKGTFFVQKVKEPMPDDAPGLGAVVPRTPPPAPVASKPEPSDLEEEDEEISDDDDLDADADADAESDLDEDDDDE